MPRLKQLYLDFGDIPDIRNQVPESYRRNLKRRRKCNDHSDATASTNPEAQATSAERPGEPKPQT